MPNQYKYNHTFEELREEEDREVLNDFYRDQSAYYKSLTEINNIFLNVLKGMSTDERKDVLLHNIVTKIR